MLQRYLRDCVELASDNESNASSNQQSPKRAGNSQDDTEYQGTGQVTKPTPTPVIDFGTQPTLDSVNFYYPCDTHSESSQGEFKWERITNQVQHHRQASKTENKVSVLQSIKEQQTAAELQKPIIKRQNTSAHNVNVSTSTTQLTSNAYQARPRANENVPNNVKTQENLVSNSSSNQSQLGKKNVMALGMQNMKKAEHVQQTQMGLGLSGRRPITRTSSLNLDTKNKTIKSESLFYQFVHGTQGKSTPRSGNAQIPKNSHASSHFCTPRLVQQTSKGMQSYDVTKISHKPSSQTNQRSLATHIPTPNLSTSAATTPSPTPRSLPPNQLPKSATFIDRKRYPQICEQECKEVLENCAVSKLVALFEGGPKDVQIST
eukprot:TRINITY_DN3501_c1_g3_i5.p2 TRINITY_DN3501_c1_g3~~TRINITY_DN3501_c1_g3_i5.p2  ORF type:complete len:375 (-),score=29.29 TRINITY_DN3501_c1_g3_i5:3494-4618(-)